MLPIVLKRLKNSLIFWAKASATRTLNLTPDVMEGLLGPSA